VPGHTSTCPLQDGWMIESPFHSTERTLVQVVHLLEKTSKNETSALPPQTARRPDALHRDATTQLNRTNGIACNLLQRSVRRWGKATWHRWQEPQAPTAQQEGSVPTQTSTTSLQENIRVTTSENPAKVINNHTQFPDDPCKPGSPQLHGMPHTTLWSMYPPKNTTRTKIL
jgi:hypothetical protein